MNPIKHLFFDLDHTLWDFAANSTETLTELFHTNKLDEKGAEDVQGFLRQYNIINDECWAAYRIGELKKEELRLVRFRKAFAHIGYDNDEAADAFGEDYIRLCPYKTNIFPNCLEVLEELKERYPLHIITNGFAEVQEVKMRESKLGPFFSEIITSELVGVLKPDPKIFHHAMQITGARPEESAMIGDNLHVDVLGARKVGMDGVWFNPNKEKEDGVPTHEIRDLIELLDLY